MIESSKKRVIRTYFFFVFDVCHVRHAPAGVYNRTGNMEGHFTEEALPREQEVSNHSAIKRSKAFSIKLGSDFANILGAMHVLVSVVRLVCSHRQQQ